MPRRAALFFAHVVPGIEDIAAAELERAGARIRDTLSRFDRRDGVVLFATPDIARVMRCGTIENVFQVVLDTPLPQGRTAPARLGRKLDRTALERALLAHHALRPKRGGRSFRVVARVAGRHPFRRDDIERALMAAVGALLPGWMPVAGPAAVEVWAHVIGERALVAVRLSGDELAQRRYKRAHLPASLKPTVARALVLLTQPRSADVFLDPMAGAGTLLRERAEVARSRRIAGGDIDPEALAAARVNVGRGTLLARWDATRLPLRDGCVDAIVTNPPYGRQHGAMPDLERLSRAMLREVARVLRRHGRCVLLTGEPATLLRAVPPALDVHAKHRLLLRGLAVTAFVMVRR